MLSELPCYRECDCAGLRKRNVCLGFALCIKKVTPLARPRKENICHDSRSNDLVINICSSLHCETDHTNLRLLARNISPWRQSCGNWEVEVICPLNSNPTRIKTPAEELNSMPQRFTNLSQYR